MAQILLWTLLPQQVAVEPARPMESLITRLEQMADRAVALEDLEVSQSQVAQEMSEKEKMVAVLRFQDLAQVVEALPSLDQILQQLLQATEVTVLLHLILDLP
jgi:DNA-directed RNA polymerase specialized sigma subunit